MKSDQAITWAHKTLAQQGYLIQGDIEIIRAMPWSQVARFSTSRGFVYFKQMAEQFAVEPTVLTFLHENFAAPVPSVIAANRDLKCFLMPYFGETLRGKLKISYDLSLASKVLRSYAEIQTKAVNHTKQVLALGIKDWRLMRLPSLYQELLLQSDFLQQDGVSEDELAKLYALAPTFNHYCEQLSGFAIPETIEQGDFQDNNVLLAGSEDICINDWGDANVTHPFFSLGSWLDSASRHHDLYKDSSRYTHLVDAYLAAWLPYGTKDKLQQAFMVAERIRPVLFTLNFCRVASCPGMEQLGQFKGYIATALREFIVGSL